MRRLILLIVFASALATATGCFVPAYSGDPVVRTEELIYTSESSPPPAAATKGGGKVTQKQVEALIEQLASPNKAPDIRSDSPNYGPEFNQVAQQRVWDARKELHALGFEAFPTLVKHVDDQRYSFTDDGGASLVNWSVGSVCLTMIRCQICPWPGTFHASGRAAPGRGHPRPNYLAHARLGEPARTKAWWEARHEKSIRDIQIEVLEWQIAEEAKAPETYPEEERKQLQEILAKLRASDAPHLPADWPIHR